jgi:replicative DNA helicase
VGGFEYLAELLDAVPSSANIAHHCEIVKDRATRRRMIDTCGEAIRKAHAPGDIETSEVLEGVQADLYKISTQATADSMVWVKKSLLSTFEQIQTNQETKGGITGIPSGLVDLDDMTGGWQKTDLVVLAGRPAMGKTGCAVGFALHAAISHQTPVAIFSLEMSARQLNQRMLCHEALVDLSRVLRGGLTDDDYLRLTQAAGHLNSAPIAIDDRGGVSVNYIRARARRLKSECPDLGLVLVDFVQLMNGKGDNENDRITDSIQGCKEIAKELDLTMIALSQLSRKNEERAEKRPQLSDLRGSGSLEQAADIVLFLHRPEYYVSPAEADKNNWRNKAELIIGKHRNGPTDTVDLFFRKECVRFESFTESGSWAIPTSARH